MSGFQSPNYTQTPNDLFDVMMARMGDAELRVVLAVVRQTMGWHRERQRMSLTMIERMTGLSRQGAINGINDAMARGVIDRVKFGNSYAYGLVVNEVDYPNGESVNEVDQPLVNEVDPIKRKQPERKTNQKKTKPPTGGATRRAGRRKEWNSGSVEFMETAEAIARWCYGEDVRPERLPPGKQARIKSFAGAAVRDGYGPQHVKAAREHWYANHFAAKDRTKSAEERRPSIEQAREHFEKARAAKAFDFIYDESIKLPF